MFWEIPFADNHNHCLNWMECRTRPRFSVGLFLIKPSSRKEPVYATVYAGCFESQQTLLQIKWESSVVIIPFHRSFSLPILDLNFWDSILRIGTVCSCEEHGDSGFQPIIQRPSGSTSNGFFKWKQGKQPVIRSPHLYQNIFRNTAVKWDQASVGKNKLLEMNSKACRMPVQQKKDAVLLTWLPLLNEKKKGHHLH